MQSSYQGCEVANKPVEKQCSDFQTMGSRLALTFVFQSQSGSMTGPEPSARSQFRLPVLAGIALLSALGAFYAFIHFSRRPRVVATVAPRQRLVRAQTHKPMRTLQAGRYGPSYDDVAEAQIEPAPEPRIERFKLDRPVSIAGLLRDAGLEEPERNAWAQAFRSSAHWGILRPGHQVALYKDPETGQIQALEYDLDDDSVIMTKTVGDGVVFSTRKTLTYQPQAVAYSLSLAQGLDTAAATKHLPNAVVEQIKDAYATRLPQLGANGTLKLIYKELVTPDGAHHRAQDLQACKLQVGRHSYSAFSFHDEHGHEHLYDEHGKPLQPQFLRFPVKFAYISSGFSPSRYHPILHIYRPHVGIDLAARYGTPVKAVSDGKVQFADWDGEMGRCIRIQHDNGLVSVYAHLSAVSPEVKPGAPVRIGQIIGYVGSTGLSTGPHLHYALYRDGQFVDPLTANLDEGGSDIPTVRRPLFERFKKQFDKVFADLHGITKGGVAEAAVDDPSMTATDAMADESPQPMVMPPPPHSRHRSTHHQPVHLVRGGLLREGNSKAADSGPLEHLIHGGLLGDPSL
jgi:murein DD-endopeptidase MepM/ murein hydrolase activator NlpD